MINGSKAEHADKILNDSGEYFINLLSDYEDGKISVEELMSKVNARVAIHYYEKYCELLKRTQH